MPVVTNPSPTRLTILGDYLNDSFAQAFVVMEGSNLAFDEDTMLVSGTATDLSLSILFDAEAASAAAGQEVSAPDQFLLESRDIPNEIPAETDAEGVITSLLLSYGFNVQGHMGAPTPHVSFLGASISDASFGLADNIVVVQAEHVTLNTRGGNDRVTVAENTTSLVARLGTGNDTATGSVGDDTIIGGAGDDYIVGNEGDDRLAGSAGRDVLVGGVGDDTVNGGANADIVFGNSGDDRVTGGGGRDVLIGGEGDAGNDVLIGGQGADAFVFVTDPSGAQSGRTVILDFNADEDMLWTGPSNNGTWDAATAYDNFLSGAVQRANLVVYAEGDYSVVIWNMVLDDISADTFVDGPSGGYYAWADLG